VISTRKLISVAPGMWPVRQGQEQLKPFLRDRTQRLDTLGQIALGVALNLANVLSIRDVDGMPVSAVALRGIVAVEHTVAVLVHDSGCARYPRRDSGTPTAAKTVGDFVWHPRVFPTCSDCLAFGSEWPSPPVLRTRQAEALCDLIAD